MKKILIAVLFLLGCKKEEAEPEAEKFVEVTYVAEFSKSTDFMFEYNDSTGAHKDTIYGFSKYVLQASIKDQANRDNIRVGACVVKTSDIGNCTMKVAAIIAVDTIKKCTLGTCCTAN